MAVKIRLQRFGKKKQPIYKIVAADSRAKRDGRNLEVVGQYSPNAAQISTFKDARVFYWLGVGAQPTDTVKNLLQKNGLWMRWALKKQKKDDALTNSLMEKWQMQQELKAKKAVEKKERRKAKKKSATAVVAPAVA